MGSVALMKNGQLVYSKQIGFSDITTKKKPNKFSFGHNGGIDGFSAIFGYFPKEKCAFALTSNGTNYDNNKISIALLNAFYNKPFGVPSFKTYTLKAKDLKTYLGVYSIPSFPLKITITKSKNILVAQATGQSPFNLTAIEKDIFEFDQAGIILEFNTNNQQVIFKQGDRIFKLTKE